MVITQDTNNVWTTAKSGQLPSYELAILQKIDENPPKYSEYQKELEAKTNAEND